METLESMGIPPSVAIVALVVLGGILIFAIGRMTRESPDPFDDATLRMPPGPVEPPPARQPSSYTQADIDVALKLGNKIEAIRVYRALHGVDLKTAKAAVDRMQAGEASQPSGGPTMSDVQAALDDGKKILAIKIYRELHGVGLKEAKDAVDRMQ